MSVTIWHNPRCSKSRETLKLLQEHGIEPEVRLYLQDSPSAEELKQALQALGQSAQTLIRSKEAAFRDMFPDASAVNDEQLIAAMVGEPKLIERPLVITDKGAALGRPPEQVLSIL